MNAERKHKMKMYYAHNQAIYGSAQEVRDVHVLNCLGFEVENPSATNHREQVKFMREQGKSSADIMEYFKGIVLQCDGVAFRALPDGRIPAGVAAEVELAVAYGNPIIELPSGRIGRRMSVDETREYLAEIGQR